MLSVSSIARKRSRSSRRTAHSTCTTGSGAVRMNAITASTLRCRASSDTPGFGPTTTWNTDPPTMLSWYADQDSASGTYIIRRLASSPPSSIAVTSPAALSAL